VRLVIVGAGAVGSLWGARLAVAGHAVTLVARREHVSAIRAKGLRVDGRSALTVRLPARETLPPRLEAEAVLLTVKAFDLAHAARAVGTACRTPIPLLLPQNGLGVEEVAVRELRASGWEHPERFVVRAVSSVPATLVEPGVVREAGHGEVVLGSSEGPAGPSADFFFDLLTGAGFSVRRVPDLAREVWRKAIVNAAINPVTAVYRVPNGDLRSGPHREEALRLLREALLAAFAAGYEFDSEELVADFDRVVRATAENRSSMRQDVERGRPTEVDAILGELLRSATVHGLSLPALTEMAAKVERLSPGTRTARKPS